MVRLIDIARAAGVSHGTASNVFNNPDSVRPELRERVLAAARAAGYAGPDPRGRLLREGRFNALAVMPPSHWNIRQSLGNPVFGQFLEGIGAACDEVGANLVLTPGTPDSARFPGLMADALIFARYDPLEAAEAARLRIPYTVVDYDPGPQVSSVRVDARAGARAAARHLAGLGHRRFAILSFLREVGPARVHPAGAPRAPEAAGTATDQEKYAGYGEALAEMGVDVGTVPMVQAEADDPVAAGLLMDLAPGATAFLSMSVLQGVALVREARRRGLSVPRDVSVVGYNDTAAALACDPPLTTVDGRTREKGLAAGRQALAGSAAGAVVLEPALILRASTAPPPGRG
jgi:DNA-binding LacI/PurR family transcriptional regulator